MRYLYHLTEVLRLFTFCIYGTVTFVISIFAYSTIVIQLSITVPVIQSMLSVRFVTSFIVRQNARVSIGNWRLFGLVNTSLLSLLIWGHVHRCCYFTLCFYVSVRFHLALLHFRCHYYQTAPLCASWMSYPCQGARMLYFYRLSPNSTFCFWHILSWRALYLLSSGNSQGLFPALNWTDGLDFRSFLE